MSSDQSTMQGSYDADANDDALTSFFDCFDAAHEYPTNLMYSHRHDYQLQECHNQLETNASKLFGDENLVDFLEVDRESLGTLHQRCSQTCRSDNRQASRPRE